MCLTAAPIQAQRQRQANLRYCPPANADRTDRRASVRKGGLHLVLGFNNNRILKLATIVTTSQDPCMIPRSV